MTYATEKPTATTVKTIAPRKTTQSEWPFRVQSYQFKDLEAARKFSRDLADSPKSGHRHLVQMSHRHLEMEIRNDGTLIVVPLLLDVTTDSPDEAEAKYVNPNGDTTRLEKPK